VAGLQVDHPYRMSPGGRTASTDGDDHVRDMIEQVLFTTPFERVNRPTFGSGLLQLVFAPNSDALVAATQLTVQGNLQQWLGDVIQVLDVIVESEDATMRVTVTYTIRRTQQVHTARFEKGI
jgi:phage baseplate assembly protein W